FLSTRRAHLPPVELRDGTFAIPVLDPEATYRLHFLDAAKGLGGVVDLKGKQAGGEPVTVRLQACGSAEVRFTDNKGKALAGYRPLLWLLAPPGPHPLRKALAARQTVEDAPGWQVPVRDAMYAPDAVWAGYLDAARYGKGPRTDAAGRVALPGLIPGATYRLVVGPGQSREVTVRAAQTLALPDLTAGPPPPQRKPPEARPVTATP